MLGLQPHFVCLPLPALATPPIFVNNEVKASLCPLAQAHHSQNLLRKICSISASLFFQSFAFGFAFKKFASQPCCLFCAFAKCPHLDTSCQGCLPAVLIRNVARLQGFIKHWKRLRGSASLDIYNVKGRASRSVFPLTTTLFVVSFRRIIPSLHEA